MLYAIQVCSDPPGRIHGTAWKAPSRIRSPAPLRWYGEWTEMNKVEELASKLASDADTA